MRVLDRVARSEGIDTSETALDTLARAADGSYRDALGLLEQITAYSGGLVELPDVLELLGAVARETLFELVDLLASGDAVHLATALEIGELEVWTSDRHMLAAAPHFGLIGRTA